MAQSLSQVYLHAVFSTKHRQPFLKTKRLRLCMTNGTSGIDGVRPRLVRQPFQSRWAQITGTPEVAERGDIEGEELPF